MEWLEQPVHNYLGQASRREAGCVDVVPLEFGRLDTACSYVIDQSRLTLTTVCSDVGFVI
jgi:hypothetical protein